MRKPIQVLVIPYRIINNEILYGIFKRNDKQVWQGIAGGVEDGEEIIEAAKREAYEEGNIPLDASYIQLESMSTIPVSNIYGDFFWGEDVYNVFEYTFGVDVTDINITISFEHTEYCFVHFEEAIKMLKWDSNRNALWELNERIKKNLLKQSNYARINNQLTGGHYE